MPLTQTMFQAASQLLEDLSAHVRLLGSPERAQVLLSVFQHPLLAEHNFAKLLVPRLGTLFINAPMPTRQVRQCTGSCACAVTHLFYNFTANFDVHVIYCSW